MLKNPANCVNYLKPNLCSPKIIERDDLKPSNSTNPIPSYGPSEMLKQEKENLEICSKCPNFLQKPTKL